MRDNPIIFPIVLILAFVGILFWAIKSSSDNYEKQPIQNDTFSVVNIDGCEYFKIKGYSFTYSLCHKGNCTNSVHLKLER
jgi:hypothetical protein